jgi:hypothetical protein
MTVQDLIREAFVVEPEKPHSEFLDEYRRITEGLQEEIRDLKETLQGDERRRFPSVLQRLDLLEQRQREKDELLEAWEKEQERRAWQTARNQRFTRVFQFGLATIATILSILVALAQLGVGLG